MADGGLFYGNIQQEFFIFHDFQSWDLEVKSCSLDIWADFELKQVFLTAFGRLCSTEAVAAETKHKM